MDQVKKAALPFRVLDLLNKQATRKFGELLTRTLADIKVSLAQVTPDPREGDFIAMTKALLPTDESVVTAWWERREIYGMGATPYGSFPGVEPVVELLSRWLAGRAMTEILAAGKKEGKPKEKMVAVGGLMFDSAPTPQEVAEVLAGLREETPTVVEDQGRSTVIDGQATVWAARFLGLPGMRVVRYQGTVGGKGGESLWNDWDFLRQRASFFTQKGRQFYRVPGSLEPIAQIARSHDKQTFTDLLLGEMEPHTTYSQILVDESTKTSKCWVRLYKFYRERGFDEDAANEKIAADSREFSVRREVEKERLTDAQAWLEQETKRRGHVQKAEKLCLTMIERDGISPHQNYKDPSFFWDRAQIDVSGVFEKGSEFSPSPLHTKSVGERVGIRDLLGEWHPGTVVWSGYAGMKVQRDDGQVRNVRQDSDCCSLV